MLVHRYQHGLSGAIYLVASIWLGAFLYILMSMISDLDWGRNQRPDCRFGAFQPIATVFLAIAVGSLALWGLWSAANPRVTEITVPIKNLPASWEGRKIAQISDVHLGAINRTGFMKHIVEEVNGVNPDMVVITGDLFDGVGDDLQESGQPAGGVASTAGDVFYHRQSRNLSRRRGLHCGAGWVADQECCATRSLISMVCSFSASSSRFANRRSCSTRFCSVLQPGKPTIVLFHMPSGMDVFKKYGVNLLLCGHTHVGQMWPFNYITHKVYMAMTMACKPTAISRSTRIAAPVPGDRRIERTYDRRWRW